MDKTVVQALGKFAGNHLWIKRDDLIPFSFGGNKARKAQLFFERIDAGGYDSVVTYGSGSSNHCRVVANMCRQRGLLCIIISPDEAAKRTFNSQMNALFGAEIRRVPLDNVHDTIENAMDELKASGKRPYFIAGGGHGDTGTEAYHICYNEIKCFEKENGLYFDYIFFASGTGTTQAGLIAGQLLNGDERRIIGISIARKNTRGRDVVIDSVRSYLKDKATEAALQAATIFVDDYTGGGYGANDANVDKTIKTVLCDYGIPLDATYTAKAFYGMTDYIAQNGLKDKRILFIHTGGTPLFFDSLVRLDDR